jgi:hypothetical protein
MEQRRERAIELRRAGWSYQQIRAALGGGSMSSYSKWLRDIPLSTSQATRLDERRHVARAKAAQTLRERRLRKVAALQEESKRQLGPLTDRDLFIAGVVAYAAEGAKQKAWHPSTSMKFANSDPRMIMMFVRWLHLLGIDPAAIEFRLYIHRAGDVGSALNFWSEFLGVSADRFKRPVLKQSKGVPRRRNTGDTYRGCLTVEVRRSCDLNRRTEGWFDAIASMVMHSEMNIPSGLFSVRP